MTISQPPKGSHFGDGVRTGPQLSSKFVAGANPMTPSTLVSTPLDNQPPGVFNTPMSLVDFIPTPVAAASIVASYSPGAGAQYLTMVTANALGITVLNTYQGFPARSNNTVIIRLDVPRNITLTSGGNDSGKTFTVYGWDQYGQQMIETITGSNAGTALGNKAFLYILGIYANAGATTTITAGVGNKFGLGHYVSNNNYIFNPMWAGAADAGTFVFGSQATATATTGDVRGTYAPSSNADGTRRLTINYYSAGGDARLFYASMATNPNLNTSPTSGSYTANPSAVILNNNALAATNTFNYITVTAPNHQFTTGETVTISGGTVNLGTVITPAAYNISAPVTVLTANTFTYPTAITATSSGAGGGALILMSPQFGNLYQTSAGRYGVAQFSFANVNLPA